MSGFPQTGQVFGRYSILGRLGQGGMGVVFRALQTDLNREVALKVLRPESAEVDEFKERFRREAGVLASVDSPNIIAIFENGEHDGCLFIATQLVQGGDLGRLLAAEGPFPVLEALEIIAQLAAGLGDAHAAGIIHRDVKPSNVLLRRTGSGNHAYLCDFGIARSTDAGLTQAGVIVGTFGYLAPERCEGGKATRSSDIYALGCLLVATLTGRPPYAGSEFQVAQHHISSRVPQWDEVFPGSTELNAIVARAMAKDPADRYPSAEEMRRALVAAIDRLRTRGPALEPTTQRPPIEPTTKRPLIPAAARVLAKQAVATRPSRAGRGVITAVVGAVLLAAGGVSFAVAAALGGDDDTTPTSSRQLSATSSASPSASSETAPTATATPRPAPAVKSTPTQPAETVAPPAPSTPEPRHERRDLGCTDRYVVVLASTLQPGASLTTVDRVLDRFDNDGHVPVYADAQASCGNLTHIEDKSSARWIPYMGTFPDATSACLARMAYSDPSTYIVRVSESSTEAAYCACDMASETLPALNTKADAEPVGDARFWVVELQNLLDDAGYNPDHLVGGHYGPLTTDMVSELQTDWALETTGRMDAATWDSLTSLACP